MTEPALREAFAHEAVLVMDADADLRAPGAAVTVELCGGWEHEPPCPLAPHVSEATREGPEVRLHVLFTTEPEHEATVRRRIDRALAAGRLQGPDGAVTEWRLRASASTPAQPDEVEWARRQSGA